MVMTCILETLLVFVACQLTTVAVQGEEEGASYIWKTGEFSACSQTCDGQRERRVVCQGRKSDGSTFDANLEDCNPQVKPVSTKSCGSECPEYGWLKEKYGKCDATCSTNDGKGNRTRRVWCSKKVGTHRKVTKDEHCIIALRHPKPPSRKSCHVKCSVIVGTCRFQLGPYGPCTQTCAGGTQTRSVSCICNYTDGQLRTVQGIKRCLRDNPGSIPIHKRSCGAICPSWHVGEWASCLTANGRKIRRRQVACLNGTTRIDETNCLSDGRKPRTKESCDLLVPPQIVVSVTIHKEPSMSTLMTTREPLHLTLKNETYQIYTIGDEIRVLVGTDVGIVCALEQDDPPADITWLLPGNYRMRDGATRRRISSSGNSSITSTLLIKNANKHNNGNYTCIAENGAGQTNATSSLVVYHIQVPGASECHDLLPNGLCEHISLRCDSALAEICCKSCEEVQD